MALTYESVQAFLNRQGIVPATQGQPSQFVGINWHKTSRVYMAMFTHRYMGCGTSDVKAVMHLLVKNGPLCKIAEHADVLNLIKMKFRSCKLGCESSQQVRELVARKSKHIRVYSRLRNRQKSATRSNNSTRRRTTIKTATKRKRAAKDPKCQKIPETSRDNGKSRKSPKDQIPKTSGKEIKLPLRRTKKSAALKVKRAATTQQDQKIPKTRRSPTIRSEINLVSEVCPRFISGVVWHLMQPVD